jgi:hypothetical protein
MKLVFETCEQFSNGSTGEWVAIDADGAVAHDRYDYCFDRLNGNRTKIMGNGYYVYGEPHRAPDGRWHPFSWGEIAPLLRWLRWGGPMRHDLARRLHAKCMEIWAKYPNAGANSYQLRDARAALLAWCEQEAKECDAQKKA